MSDEAAQAVEASEVNVVTAGADAPEAFNSPTSAAKYLASLRHNKQNTEQPAESAEPATAATESEPQGEDAAPPQEATGETQDDAPAEQPSRDLPRSWAKELTDRWTNLDPAIQDILLEQDRKASAEVRRSQNEAAEARKAAEAEQAKWKQEREQYVSRQAAYTQALENTLQAEFGDIRTMDDVRKLQAEDPFRFQQWQLRQMELGQAKAEQQANEQRSAQERMNAWIKFTKDESDAFENEVPEFKAKKDEYTKKASEVLTELGFSADELNKLASGEEKISLFDRRMQRLLFDRIRLSEIKAAIPKAIPKPVPTVQRPGTAKPAGSAQSEQIMALTQKLTKSGSLKDAQALYAARKAAQRRSS